MASDGLTRTAKSGKCHYCLRVRKVRFLTAVGEVRHGYATGHIWECKDQVRCDAALKAKLEDPNVTNRKQEMLKFNLQKGRITTYTYKR